MSRMGVGRRQPRTSCDFCRVKKLKCDRSRPCSCCVARGVECRGQPDPPGLANAVSVQMSNGNQELLLRVRRLERAVFGAERAGSTAVSVNETAAGDADVLPGLILAPIQTYADSRLQGEQQQHDHAASFRFCIRPSGTASESPGSVVPAYDGLDTPRTVWLPMPDHAVALLDSFVEHSLGLNRIVSEASARALFRDVYSDLARGHRVPNDHVAFLLAICADTAFHRNHGTRLPLPGIFESDDEATRRSFLWRKIVWDLLDNSHRAGQSSLPGIQASMILQDMIYTLEGGSARWRYLLSSSLAAARELSLNLLDSPKYANHGDDAATREMKRRVWWHLVSTDWLSSCASGPMDRTYTTSPRHMAVHYPRNINDIDLPLCDDTPAQPLETATDMSYFIARIRLAEVCREIADLLTMGPGATDIDQLRFEQVLWIDRLTEEVRDLFPPPCVLHARLPPDAPPQMHAQQQVINLALEARRARLFRPFLQSAVVERDQRFRRFQAVCIRSARAVMEIASSYLADLLDHDQGQDARRLGDNNSSGSGSSSRGSNNGDSATRSKASLLLPLTRYSAIVTHHLFQACVVMAADPSLAGDDRNQTSNGTSGGGVPEVEIEARREALARSSRLLERLSEQSPMAADLVGRLVRVLQRYCVVVVHASSPTSGAGASAGAGLGDVSQGVFTDPDPTATRPGQFVSVPVGYATPGMSMGMDMGTGAGAGLLAPLAPPPTTQGLTGVSWGVPDFTGFGGLWENFMGNPLASEDLGQVFTDLDHFGGPF